MKRTILYSLTLFAVLTAMPHSTFAGSFDSDDQAARDALQADRDRAVNEGNLQNAQDATDAMNQIQSGADAQQTVVDYNRGGPDPVQPTGDIP